METSLPNLIIELALLAEVSFKSVMSTYILPIILIQTYVSVS